MTIDSLSITERQTDDQLDVAIDRLVAWVNEATTQVNTNTAGLASINTMLDGLADPVTITIDTITSYATALSKTNEAFATLETQMKTLIAALKA
jgi:hypothetical protein